MAEPIEIALLADRLDDVAEQASYQAFAEEQHDEQITLHAASVVNARPARMEKRKALLAEIGKLAPQYQHEAQKRIAEFDEESRQLADGVLVNLEERVTKAADKHIVTAPPTFPPRDQLHATEVNGAVADLPHLHPVVAATVIRAAIARNDLAYIARAKPVLQSLAAYKPAFAKSVDVANVLSEMATALDSPQQKRSRAAATWKREAITQLKILREQVTNPRGDVALFASTGALSLLFPSRNIPK
jgi:hypothetical protein